MTIPSAGFVLRIKMADIAERAVPLGIKVICYYRGLTLLSFRCLS